MRVCLTVFVTALLLGRAVASAQVPVPSPNDVKLTCGEVHRQNTAYQYGDFGTWLEYVVSTYRTVNTCTMSVGVEAYVTNAQQSAYSDEGVFSATAKKQVLVPYPGLWQTNGRHYFTYWYFFVPPLWWTYELTPTVSHTLIELRFRRDPEMQCVELGGEWDGYECYIPNCPLIVDTNSDGYRLTDASAGVLFDLDADGSPERIAWTEADSDEAFIVMDRNGNGRIDDGSELFGDHTPAYPGRRETTANGFDALRFLESPSYGVSRRDSVVDGNDAAFAALMLWRDRNHNGISEAEELAPLSESGLRAIHTDYKLSRRRDRFGNEFRQRAKGVWDDGESFIYDVWLRRQ
jgi:hypothetical protein